MRALVPILLLTTGLAAQPPQRQREILEEYAALLQLTNVYPDLPALRKNAEAIQQLFARRGVNTRLLEVENSAPVVYGEIPAPNATRTVVFYAHYDGQPVDPARWSTPPFTPVLKASDGKPVDWRSAESIPAEARLYARAVADDKAPIMAIAAALDALKAEGRAPSVNVKFFFEGEEEAGSPHLRAIVEKHKDLLKADVWLICDGPVHQNRQQQVYFGARGVASMSLTVYGPRRELHSGHYGNWAPNPAMMLSRLLATMTDGEGRVLVENFYDGIAPLSEVEKQAIAKAPAFDEELKRELWLNATEGAPASLLDRINLPSLNIRGLASAAIGTQSRNVVPNEATASLDLRLVKGLDWKVQSERVIAHIRKQGYFVVDHEPTREERLAHARVAKVIAKEGYNAVRTPMDLPISRAVLDAVGKANGPVVALPTLGGSVPIIIFEEVLGAPLIGIPIVNHDNNQHSHDENLRLENLWQGIRVMQALLTLN
jgi:acetylornithine deacetylase/succinyl-diaminopimelate desuccinylase-like protein